MVYWLSNVAFWDQRMHLDSRWDQERRSAPLPIISSRACRSSIWDFSFCLRTGMAPIRSWSPGTTVFKPRDSIISFAETACWTAFASSFASTVVLISSKDAQSRRFTSILSTRSTFPEVELEEEALLTVGVEDCLLSCKNPCHSKP